MRKGESQLRLDQLFDFPPQWGQNRQGAQPRLPRGMEGLEAGGITCDSRQVKRGWIFVCVPGSNADGHAYAAQAVQKGAVAVVCQRDCGLPNQILTEDPRWTYAALCANFFERPAQEMTLTAVTGTNGKTTVSWVLWQLLRQSGRECGLIGTVCSRYAGRILPAHYTTPDPWELQGLLRQMADHGCTHVVMEASSHALAQKRLTGCHFACGVFLNLTPEHLDLHGTMEAYYQAKKSLFDRTDRAVCSYDDEYGRRLATEVPCPVRTISVGDDRADLTLRQPQLTGKGSQFVLVGQEQIARSGLSMPGEFSLHNGLAAFAAAVELGVPFSQAAQLLPHCLGAPGRMEVITTAPGFTVIRDYAHTPDGLHKALETVRQFTAGRVLVLFGCPGRRDPANRPAMAREASRLSDGVVLTSDNPRDEDPGQIIRDALPGLEEGDTPWRVIPDRREAIFWALDQCRSGDCLLLAGKGHEDYQVLDHCTICFDERAIVRGWLRERRPDLAEDFPLQSGGQS